MKKAAGHSTQPRLELSTCELRCVVAHDHLWDSKARENASQHLHHGPCSAVPAQGSFHPPRVRVRHNESNPSTARIGPIHVQARPGCLLLRPRVSCVWSQETMLPTLVTRLDEALDVVSCSARRTPSAVFLRLTVLRCASGVHFQITGGKEKLGERSSIPLE